MGLTHRELLLNATPGATEALIEGYLTLPPEQCPAPIDATDARNGWEAPPGERPPSVGVGQIRELHLVEW